MTSGLDPGQAAGDQVLEEREPGRSGLRGGDLDPEDLPVPVGVDGSSELRWEERDAPVRAGFLVT